jgi:hypothetical protein
MYVAAAAEHHRRCIDRVVDVHLQRGRGVLLDVFASGRKVTRPTHR